MKSPECVERWPECEDGAFDPRCCRFPKSCSCEVEICGATIAVVSPAKCELPKGHEGRHKWSTVEWNFDARQNPAPPKNFGA